MPGSGSHAGNLFRPPSIALRQGSNDYARNSAVGYNDPEGVHESHSPPSAGLVVAEVLMTAPGRRHLLVAGLMSLVCPLLITIATGDTRLQSAAPQDLSIQDSIPRRAGERVILFNKRLEADWVVALTNLPYEETRPKIRDLIDQAFGIASENEIKARVDVNRPFERRPQEPLFGDGAIDFHAIGVPVSEGREWRIQTKPYNKSWRNNYSQSGWRIIDGGRLFAKACSLIVVSRIDRSREWVVMHPGIPLPFTASGETRLVTDSEIKVIERLLTNEGQPTTRYFVVPDRHFSTNALVEVMTAITNAAKELP